MNSNKRIALLLTLLLSASPILSNPTVTQKIKNKTVKTVKLCSHALEMALGTAIGTFQFYIGVVNKGLRDAIIVEREKSTIGAAAAVSTIASTLFYNGYKGIKHELYYEQEITDRAKKMVKQILHAAKKKAKDQHV